MNGTTTRWLGAGALALALAACGQKGGDEFAGATPDVAGLTLEVQGGAAEGLPVAARTLALAPAATTTPVGDADDLATARDRIKALNQAVQTFVGTVAEVAQGNGTPAIGDRMLYGPVDRCVLPGADPASCDKATFVLGVKREAEHLFSFLLEARPTTSTLQADYRTVAVGWMARGAQEHRGVGQLGLDLHALAAVQPAFTGDGALLAGFTNGPVRRSVRYRLVQFKAPGAAEAITAVYVGHRNDAGVTRVRVVAPADLLGGPNGPELLAAHAAWVPGVGGRAYSVVSNWERMDWTATPPALVGPSYGDVPVTSSWEDHYWFSRACYTPPAVAGEAPALVFKEWFYCARTPGVASGPLACMADAVVNRVPPIVVAGSGTWASSCPAFAGAPAELDPPTGAADQPEGTDLEPGQALMAPPDAPASPGTVAPPATGSMPMPM
jgi:hypothetical protein